MVGTRFHSDVFAVSVTPRFAQQKGEPGAPTIYFQGETRATNR